MPSNEDVNAAIERTSAGSAVKPQYWFIGAYLFAFVLSKFLGFMPGYALDDYVTRSREAEILTTHFIAQGRFTFALLMSWLQLTSLHLNDFNVVGLFGLGLFSGLFASSALRIGARSNPLLLAACGALAGAYPYLTEYVSFRQAILPTAVLFFLCWIATDAYQRWRSSRQHVHLAIFLGCSVLAAGINQLAVPLLCIAVLLHDFLDAAPNGNFRLAVRGVARTACIGLAITVLYFVAAFVVLKLCGGEASQRTKLVPSSELVLRFKQIALTCRDIFLGSEKVASSASKWGLWIATAVLMVSAAIRAPRTLGVAIFFLAVATGLTLAPVAVGEVWWPVPRTLIALPFAVISYFLLLEVGQREALVQMSAFAILASAAVMAAHSNAVLSDQQRLNRWDLEKAREIAERVATRFPNAPARIALPTGAWTHTMDPEMPIGDMNISALGVTWAVDAMFDEATGRQMTVTISEARAAQCASRPKFPDEAAIFVDGDDVVVCL